MSLHRIGSLHHAPYILCPTSCTLCPVPCTLCPAPCALHPAMLPSPPCVRWIATHASCNGLRLHSRPALAPCC